MHSPLAARRKKLPLRPLKRLLRLLPLRLLKLRLPLLQPRLLPLLTLRLPLLKPRLLPLLTLRLRLPSSNRFLTDEKTGLRAGFFMSAQRQERRKAGKTAAQSRSNSAMDSTCDVCGNMFTTPAPFIR